MANYTSSHTGAEIDEAVSRVPDKVDKVVGKGLSANDFTSALKANYDSASTHAQSIHAPSAAQKNSDITKAEIEGKLTGKVSTHNHTLDVISETTAKKIMTDAERTKLSGIDIKANNYAHPAAHPASIITQDATHRFSTDIEKSAWNTKAGVSNFNNVSVPVASFVPNSQYSSFPFRAAVSLSSVVSSHVPEVIFDVEQATSGQFSPVVQSYNGGVYLYAKTAPAVAVVVPTILCWEV